MEMVMAAGSMLGGLAGQAIMGKPASIGPDTSIPGIKKATIQKATKADAGLQIAQVDPTGAINYFKQAADSYSAKALEGVNYYTGAIQQAINNINSTTDKANLEINPIARQGTLASKEYMRMLGLNPPSDLSNSGFFDQVKNSGHADIAAQMQEAENITDPAQRAATKQNIMSSLINNTSSLSSAEQQAALQSVQPEKAPPQLSVEQWLKLPENKGKYQINSSLVNKNTNAAVQGKEGAAPAGSIPLSALTSAGQSAYKQWEQQQQGQYETQYQSQLRSAQEQAVNSALAAKQQLGQSLASQYGSQYSSELDRGYNGDQITKKLEATPGYQFQQRQGQQAIARLGAASGLLSSGNTAAAQVDYSEKTAQNYFQNHLANLQPLMESGNQATGIIANNIIGQGNSLAQVYGNLGAGLLGAYQNIGQAYNNSYTNSGQAYLQAALANMAAQNDAIKTKHQQNFEASQNSQKNAISAGYLNLANNDFNFKVGNELQAGNTFAAGVRNSGTSQGAGTGWPSFNPNSMAWYTV